MALQTVKCAVEIYALGGESSAAKMQLAQNRVSELSEFMLSRQRSVEGSSSAIIHNEPASLAWENLASPALPIILALDTGGGISAQSEPRLRGRQVQKRDRVPQPSKDSSVTVSFIPPPRTEWALHSNNTPYSSTDSTNDRAWVGTQ